MADLTVKQHDYWPRIRFKVSDQAGLLDLTLADSIKLILTGPASITGTIDAMDPNTSGGYNASYLWKSGETAQPGSYRGEIEINWSAGASPAAVETAPNTGTFQIVIEADLG